MGRACRVRLSGTLRAAAPALLQLGVVWLAVGTARPAGAAEERFVEMRVSDAVGVVGIPYEVIERARMGFEAEITEHWTAVATVEAALHEGRRPQDELKTTLERSELGPLLDAAGCSWPAETNTIFAISNAAGYLSVERLYADYYHPSFDVRVGRQALHWGSGLFFNPTDPFPELLLREPWRARRGVNAVRINVPFLEVHDVTVVGALDDTLQSGRVAGRLRFNFLETDWALLGAYRGDNQSGLVGIDFKGTLVVGWWVEAAFKLGDRGPSGMAAGAKGARPDVYEEIAAGIDYSFPGFADLFDNVVLSAQYYRNGSGALSADEYTGGGIGGALASLATPSCTDPRASGLFGKPGKPDPFAPATAGRDYLLLNVQATFTPELSASLAGLQNLDDGTAMLIPTFLAHPAPWMDIGVSGQVPFVLWQPARDYGGEFVPRDKDLQIVAPVAPGRVAVANLKTLVPTATLTLWMRGSF